MSVCMHAYICKFMCSMVWQVYPLDIRKKSENLSEHPSHPSSASPIRLFSKTMKYQKSDLTFLIFAVVVVVIAAGVAAATAVVVAGICLCYSVFNSLLLHVHAKQPATNQPTDQPFVISFECFVLFCFGFLLFMFRYCCCSCDFTML